MAGGQERILRRRIKSIQSTQEDHQGDGADRRLPDRARPGPDRRRPPLPPGHGPHRPGDGAGRPRRRRPAARHPRARCATSPSWRWWPTGACAGATTPWCSGPPSACWPATGRRRHRLRLFTVGKKAQGYFRFRGQEVERSFTGMSERPTFSRRPGGGRRRPHPVRPRRGRPGDDRVHPLPLGRAPRRSRSASCCRWSTPATRRARTRTWNGPSGTPPPSPPNAGATPSSSPTPPSSSRRWPPGRRRPRSSTPCSRRRPPSSPPGSGPWPPPPTTPAS